MSYKLFYNGELYKVLTPDGRTYTSANKDDANNFINNDPDKWTDITDESAFHFSITASKAAKDFIVFNDAEFNRLLHKWNNEVIKAKHGTPKSKSTLEMLFMGRTLVASYNALKYAYEQKHVTLNFNYEQRTLEPKRTSGSSDSRRRVGDSNLGQPRGTDETASAISKRVTRLE